MIDQYTIHKMQESDIPDAIGIWREQTKKYCSNVDSFPDFWLNDSTAIFNFLIRKVKANAAIVAKSHCGVLGYLAYDEFPFHGEKSVFCPAIAHAAVEEHKQEVYASLYQHFSKEWVGRNIFNNMWTIHYNDIKLRSILFDLGFGSYLIDAFANAKKVLNFESTCSIKRAGLVDMEDLYRLIEESREFYRSAPLFLKREPYSRDDLSNFIKEGHIYLAVEENKTVGFINVSISQNDNVIDLSVKNSGLIDEIGAYINPEYRCRQIGKALLNNVFDICDKNGIKYVHVDFETANLLANKFWRKYFDPVLLSMRRSVNKDANDGIDFIVKGEQKNGETE